MIFWAVMEQAPANQCLVSGTAGLYLFYNRLGRHAKKRDSPAGLAKQCCGTKSRMDNFQATEYPAWSTTNYCEPADCFLIVPKVWAKENKKGGSAGTLTERW